MWKHEREEEMGRNAVGGGERVVAHNSLYGALEIGNYSK